MPDGDAGKDGDAVLREAIAKTGKTALSRVVIAQRERTVALRPMGDGLMAHTLYEDRDLNSSQELFEGLSLIKSDPEMVQLATQLVQRQSGRGRRYRGRSACQPAGRSGREVSNVVVPHSAGGVGQAGIRLDPLSLRCHGVAK